MSVRVSVPGVVAAVAAVALALSGACAPPPDGRTSEAAGSRIAVLAPAAAEMLDRLGLADRIVAVGDFVRRPARLSGLPRLGAYDAPDLERIVELRVDVVVTADSRAADAVHARLASLGVEVVALSTDTFDGVFESIVRLGEAFDVTPQAHALVADMRAELDEVRSRASGRARRRVLFVVGRDPLFVAGPGSHVDVLLGFAGGDNVAADVAGAYRPLSLEAALERLPEVIIDTSDNRPGALRGRTAGAWKRWEFLPAVRDDRVWHVDPDLVVIPGVRMAQSAWLVARMIHPDALGAPADDELSASQAVAGETR